MIAISGLPLPPVVSGAWHLSVAAAMKFLDAHEPALSDLPEDNVTNGDAAFRCGGYNPGCRFAGKDIWMDMRRHQSATGFSAGTAALIWIRTIRWAPASRVPVGEPDLCYEQYRRLCRKWLK
jgi:hypothetical protein